MQLITASWVLPITRPAMRNGGVVVDGDIIVDTGRSADLAARYSDAEVVDLGDTVITPGLVNAHTHLGLTAAAGLLPPDEFPTWLSRVPIVMRAWNHDDVAASAALGAEQSLDVGVTAVGEIVYGGGAADAVLGSGVGATLYWEVLGIEADHLETVLTEAGFPFGEPTGTRWRAGISPHAPYSSSPGLLRAARELADRLRVPFAIHVAESLAEVELMRTGGGPLSGVAERLIPGFTAPDATPVAYLDSMRVLDDALAIHVCEIDESDAIRLSAAARGVALCPRSNEWLRNSRPPAARLASLRVPLSVGTDSAASNLDLDVLEDVRAIGSGAPSLSPTKLLRTVTADAAFAIGLEDRFGSIEPGMQADIAAWDVDAGDEPEAAVIGRGGRETLAALMTGGVWRRGPLADTSGRAAVDAAGSIARDKAVIALAEND